MAAKPKIESPFPEKFTNAQWARFVAEGRDLVEEETRIQFALGDLTLKMIPCHYHEGDHGVGRVLEYYADQIGLAYDTLCSYRHMAIAWPVGTRASGVPYSVHRALDACPDRFEVILHPPDGKDRWDLDDALRYAERTPHTPVNSKERLARVRFLLREEEVAAEAINDLVIHRPNVAERVMSNPDTRSAIWRANVERPRPAGPPAPAGSYGGYGRREPDRDDEPPRLPEPRPSLVEDTIASRQVLELLGLGTVFAVSMQDLIPKLRVSDFSANAKQAIKDNHRRVRAVLDWCDTVIDTGDTTMDEQLARLSQGEEPT
ncbi:DUF6192 family protein [Streptosporangium roseum]|uniref:DUF6192 family protein n=1 Tax=Streptosporangium roseum TaxID=2001 RepID=UPI00343D65F8